jgi:hypothetical protein
MLLTLFLHKPKLLKELQPSTQVWTGFPYHYPFSLGVLLWWHVDGSVTFINLVYRELIYILASTCFGGSLPSTGSFLDSSELLEIQIEWVVYHMMCGYVASVPECRGFGTTARPPGVAKVKWSTVNLPLGQPTPYSVCHAQRAHARQTLAHSLCFMRM